MELISWRCARDMARVLGCAAIALGEAGCGDAAPGQVVEDARLAIQDSGSVVQSSATGAVRQDERPAAVDAGQAAAADAGVALADATVAAPVAAPREAVDTIEVRGALVDMPLLADMGDGKKNLIQVDWDIPPSREIYLCGRITVPEDIYFRASYPVHSAGTHHTAVSVLDKPDAPDGVRLCDVSEVGRRNIAGGGVGTEGKQMPEGIAMKAPRGSQIVLNLHLFNFSAERLSGRSGSVIETVPAAQVTTIADGLAAGPLKLNVPPGPSVQTGVCTVDYEYTIFGVTPHMHEMGRHMRVVAKRAAGGEVVLHDGPYDFVHQYSYRIDPPLKLSAGDRIELACTYQNTSGQVLHFGESTKDEMCIAGLARFPAGGKSACPY